MKTLLLISIFLLVSIELCAQNAIKKSDVVIHITGSDAWGAHRFDVNIYKKASSAKVVYSFLDSLKHSEVRKDPEYERVSEKTTIQR
jgi:glutaredoxin-related protein